MPRFSLTQIVLCLHLVHPVCVSLPLGHAMPRETPPLLCACLRSASVAAYKLLTKGSICALTAAARATPSLVICCTPQSGVDPVASEHTLGQPGLHFKVRTSHGQTCLATQITLYSTRCTR